jgi:hypothetical protein
VLAEGMPDVNAITDVMARLSGTHPVFTPRLTALPGDLMLMYGSTMFFVHVLRDLVSHPELDNCWRRPWDVHARSRDVHLGAASLHGYETSPAASPCPGGCGGPAGPRRPAPAAVLRRRTHSDLRSARARSDCWPTLPHHPNPRGSDTYETLYGGYCDLYAATKPRPPARSCPRRTGSRAIARIRHPRSSRSTDSCMIGARAVIRAR